MKPSCFFLNTPADKITGLQYNKKVVKSDPVPQNHQILNYAHKKVANDLKKSSNQILGIVLRISCAGWKKKE
jgi:hypothetical protein